jgi:hypothetical protein
MHVDHINMVKFESESDSGYQTVSDHLLLMAACEQVTASVGGRIRKAGWTRIRRLTLVGTILKKGERHPHTLTSVYCLALLLHTTKRYAEATELYQRAYNGHVQTLGPQHPHTIACGNSLLACSKRNLKPR